MRRPVQAALGQIFERWDGKGYPNGLRGEQIGLPMRVAHVATQAMAFVPDGPDAVEHIVRRRAGGWFDPAVAEAFLRRGRALLAEVEEADAWVAAVEAEPRPWLRVADPDLDDVAAAFADMADLKVPFTRGHSRGVAELAAAAAGHLRLPARDVNTLRRAALFHDIGRVSVPNGIWEKAGKLSAIAWEKVRLHPYQTERILSRAPALCTLAPIAGMHHERLDGSGYYRSLAGAALPMTARLLCAADAYQAMTQHRPYRLALSPEQIAIELHSEARGGRFDSGAVEAVLAAAGHAIARPRPSHPAGLSDRELEVLQLIATGSTYRDVARELVISPRTAAHHVQHIYNKIGVSTRAAAAMFAMEHRLV
jgi:HD-GYP domain-containing protein (c-di-GMP phosphodiesterase class II)